MKVAHDQRQDIELGITRYEYGESARSRSAVLEIRTGKGYNGGVRSDCSVFWVGLNSRQLCAGHGWFWWRLRLKQSKTTIKATQKAIDKQHAEVFMPEVVEALKAEAKAHYAPDLAAGVDGMGNTYPSMDTAGSAV